MTPLYLFPKSTKVVRKALNLKEPSQAGKPLQACNNSNNKEYSMANRKRNGIALIRDYAML
jgi:hypothetical protein